MLVVDFFRGYRQTAVGGEPGEILNGDLVIHVDFHRTGFGHGGDGLHGFHDRDGTLIAHGVYNDVAHMVKSFPIDLQFQSAECRAYGTGKPSVGAGAHRTAKGLLQRFTDIFTLAQTAGQTDGTGGFR